MAFPLRIALFASLLVASTLESRSEASEPDSRFHVFLCFGQSNMEGFPGIPNSFQGPVDPRFQVLAAVDFPKLGREQGHWYPAVPPLSRPGAGLSPADFFGRALVAALPEDHRVGVINLSVGGTRIELFDKSSRSEYLATAPAWLLNTVKQYDNETDADEVLAEFLNDPDANENVDYLFIGQGKMEAEGQWNERVQALLDSLDTRDIEYDYYVAGQTAHDWATWRALLHERFLPNLWRHLK